MPTLQEQRGRSQCPATHSEHGRLGDDDVDGPEDTSSDRSMVMVRKMLCHSQCQAQKLLRHEHHLVSSEQQGDELLHDGRDPEAMRPAACRSARRDKADGAGARR